MTEKRKSIIWMSVLVCLWGLDYVIAKDALRVVDSINLLFLKYAVGMIMMLAIKLKCDRKTIVRKKDIPLFILCALFGQVMYYYCEYTAMSFLPVSLITIILTFVPAVSIIFERFFLKKQFNYKIALGIVLCTIGVMVVIGADFSILFEGRAFGYLLAFGAVLFWNIYNFITAKLSDNYSTVTMAFNQLVCTVLMLFPYAMKTLPNIDSFTFSVIGGIIYLGVGSSGMGFLIMIKGLKNLGPTITAVFSNFLPVTTTIFGWFFLGETISIIQIVGGTLVIAASCMVIMEKGKMEEQSNDRKAEPDDAN